MTSLDTLLGINHKPKITHEYMKDKYGNLYRWYVLFLRQNRPITCPLVKMAEKQIKSLREQIIDLWDVENVGDINIYNLKSTISDILYCFTDSVTDTLKASRNRNTDLAGMFKIAAQLLSESNPKYRHKWRGFLSDYGYPQLTEVIELIESMDQEELDKV